MKSIRFTKMHGLGNDFVIINCLNGLPESPEEFAKKICDRRLGVGADQLLTVEPSKVAGFKMSIYNADGSCVEMCGNGIRCFALYLKREGLIDKNKVNVETAAGIIKPEITGNKVRVDMGKPVLKGDDIPVDTGKLNVPLNRYQKEGLSGTVLRYPLKILDKEFEITCVSMGNPHCVIYLKDVDSFDVEKYGRVIETHTFFPRRINVEFIEVINRSEIKMRVWERGSGETLACGTGACASVVSGIINGLNDRKVTVHLRGGYLDIEWDRDDCPVIMTGPGTFVFDGEYFLR